MSDARATLAAIIAEIGLRIETDFVPFSRSRNAKPSAGHDQPWRSLNWKVRLYRGEGAASRLILETEYSAGEAHCPAYKRFKVGSGQMTVEQKEALDTEIQTGREVRGGGSAITGKPILPDSVDVIASLAMDSSVIDFSTYEDWAADYGYDPDSRSGEAIYRACLSHALALRAAIGEGELSRLRDAAQEL